MSSEEHMLNIWLKKDTVIRDDLLKAGLLEGKDEDECDFYVEQEEGLLCIPPLAVQMNGDRGTY